MKLANLTLPEGMLTDNENTAYKGKETSSSNMYNTVPYNFGNTTGQEGQRLFTVRREIFPF